MTCKALLALSFLGSLCVVGCGGSGSGGGSTPPQNPTVTAVSVSCTPTSIQTGQTSQCSATVSGTGSYSSAVTWAATDGTITSAGVFMPSAAGTAAITATSTEAMQSGSATVTVTAPPTITSVGVSCTPTTVSEGQTSQCTATVQGTGNFDPTVTWAANPSSIGTVNSAGVFTATSAGTATITATSTQDSTKSGSGSVAVTSPNPLQHGALVASPSLYASGLSANMTISIWIPDPDLDTNSVTAYETNKSGVPISSKGVLNDAGKNGDATAGDKIFTLQFAVNDASPATHYYAVSYKSLSTGAIYSTEVDTTTSVPTVSVSDSSSYSQNIEDSMNRLINAVSSYQAMLPTPSTKMNQTALVSYISAMVSVMGNIQQLSSYDSINPLASHVYMNGEQPTVTPLSTQSSSFWSFLASFVGLGDIVQTGTRFFNLHS